MKKFLFSLFVLEFFVLDGARAASPGMGSYAEIGAAMQTKTSVSINNVTKGCEERELPLTDWKTSNEYIYQSQSRYKGKFAFECGNGYCDADQVIFMPKSHYFVGKEVKEQKLYYCAPKGDSKWVEWSITDIADCNIEKCRLTDEASAINGYYIMDTDGGNVGLSTGSGAQLLIANRTKICKCKTIGEAKTACENSGGSWVNGKCSCDASKNIKVSASGEVCVCISSDYESKGRNGCQKKQSVIDAEKQQQQQAITQQRKTACENSGGKWVNGKCSCDSSLNLKTQNNVCVCTDSNYYRDSNNNCVLTDEAARKQQCETDTSKNSGAYWDSVTKKCLCADTSLVWINGQCITDPQVTACLNIDGAEWNAILNECQCKDSNMEFNSTRTACVLTAAAQLSANQGTSRTNILNAISKLDNLSSGFKESVWKNEEGEFNTSRLISDSVAGVVLGTAGGLITSSVVKKNQVENGFEDIQCTVGGQVVAGWGDQFQVGIQ